MARHTGRLLAVLRASDDPGISATGTDFEEDHDVAGALLAAREKAGRRAAPDAGTRSSSPDQTAATAVPGPTAEERALWSGFGQAARALQAARQRVAGTGPAAVLRWALAHDAAVDDLAWLVADTFDGPGLRPRLAEALDVPGGISLDVFVPALVEVALADAFATARVCTQLPAALQERDRDDLAEVVRRAVANRVGRYDRSEWLVESRA